MKTVVHVNKHIIGSNNKHGTCEPAATIRTYKGNQRGKIIRILDRDGNLVGKFLQADEGLGIKPLNCGAKVYFALEEGCKAEVEK